MSGYYHNRICKNCGTRKDLHLARGKFICDTCSKKEHQLDLEMKEKYFEEINKCEADSDLSLIKHVEFRMIRSNVDGGIGPRFAERSALCYKK